MAQPPKPWKVEYAKTQRSRCKTCKYRIDKYALRLGKIVQATKFDGFYPEWNHASCILGNAKLMITMDSDIEGLESLRWDDQLMIKKHVGEGVVPDSDPVAVAVTVAVAVSVEVSSTSCATCRCCNKKISEGEIRISTKPPEGRRISWNHAVCHLKKSTVHQLEKLWGWNSLSDAHRTTLGSLVNKSKGALELHPKCGTKRKTPPKEEEEPSIDEIGTDVLMLKSQLELQSRTVWALKDDLKEHVTTQELREMLKSNEQYSRGSELDLWERCADGMLFGGLEKCPNCSGLLHYSSGAYWCSGFLTDWVECLYSTTKPQRVKQKWKIPAETNNDYLLKWFKSQKVKKPERVFPPETPFGPSGSQDDPSSSQTSDVENIAYLKVVFAGFPDESMVEWKKRTVEAGGYVDTKITRETSCLVVGSSLSACSTEIKKARTLKIPVLKECYLYDCIKAQKKLPFDLYEIESTEVKEEQQSSAQETFGLEDLGHILEDGDSTYNTTLNMINLSTGINTYYILRIIQDKGSPDCHLFRKWGQIGNKKIGSKKLEKMSKSDSILTFKRLFRVKTGNLWEDWEDKTFQKKPGKFYPMDIGSGVIKKFRSSTLDSKLEELMKTLFDLESYRAAMMEFDINLSTMLLKKLSSKHIEEAFNALKNIEDLLNSTAYTPEVRENLILGASHKFFTFIPSTRPHIIRGVDDVKQQVKMLESLRDIKIASEVVCFESDSIDEMYEKLHCRISPLSRDSEDFKLIEKYLQTTHAPTHTEWELEVKEVFSLEREGEMDKYMPYRTKLNNKMLLWHGSRLMNFVGILSQGLRIAPPEAPVTAYMFGKGIYFADLGSKSAQYCNVNDPKNPDGFMLLSEVALGEMYELTKAQYMDKPAEGKDSTKGLGQNVTLESQHVKWGDDVVVPCGKVVASEEAKASKLLYNEYIVYDTAQVKLQFLLKVRFHFK